MQPRFDTPGSVQAFDAVTGIRRWVFYTVPQSNDAFGADTWENGSWRYTGHANVWGLMSLDEARGLLYVPTSTPSSDYWGGRRLGANLFAESLVCLDARTGERIREARIPVAVWAQDYRHWRRRPSSARCRVCRAGVAARHLPAARRFRRGEWP